MEKSITRHIKYTCINYIFFALHLTKGQELTPPYIHTDYPPKKRITYEENFTYHLQSSFSNFSGIQSSTLYFSYYM